MTQKELQKLNRRQLLELLIIQTERADQLEEKLHAIEAKLSRQQVTAEQVGSIAEASLQISGIFEAAESAADLYLENIRKQEDQRRQMEEDATSKAEEIIAQANIRAGMIIAEAEKRCVQLQREADEYREQTEIRIKEQFDLMNEIFHRKCDE